MTGNVPNTLDSLHESATSLFLDGLDDCRLEPAFDRHLHFEDDDVLIRTPHDILKPIRIPLSDYKRIFVVAIGKVALPMLQTLLERMKRRKGLRGICCGAGMPKKRNWRIRYFVGGHPLPNEDSLASAKAALNLLRKASKDTFIFFLISRGGSAMFDFPLDPSISLDDLIAFHETLLGSGASIPEINTVRKHISAVKGGRLALAAPEATKLSILLPDVPIRQLDALASSPTLPDRSTIEDTKVILQRYSLLPKFPLNVRRFFERADMPESPGNKSWKPPFLAKLVGYNEEKSGGRRPDQTVDFRAEATGFANSQLDTLLSSHDLVNATRDHAKKIGYKVVIDNTCDDWNYADAARYLLERFHALRRKYPRLCLISGGEVTVTLDRAPGTGGRNQQFALVCALDLAKYEGEPLAVFSASSDGLDGNSSSAGAIADTTTVARARAFGFDPQESLVRFDACPLFTSLGDSVVTGPTGQNLRDIRLLIADQE
jgi:glycerate 2-kinase